MDKTAKIIIALAVVAAVAGGAILLTGSKDDAANTGSNTPNNSDTGGSEAVVAATITYTDSGFSPATVTVKAGEAIRVVNNSGGVVGPSSDSHPAHDQNTELNFPDIDPGQGAAVTVTTKGIWGLHNHLKEDHHMTIIVE